MSRKLTIVLAGANLVFPIWIVAEAFVSVTGSRPNPFQDFVLGSLLALRVAIIVGFLLSAFFILRGSLGLSLLALLTVMGFNFYYQVDISVRISEAILLTAPAISGSQGPTTYSFAHFFLETYDKVALAYTWLSILGHISLVLYSLFVKPKRLP